MTVYLQDTDLTLHHGDALDTLRTMPAGSVDCCITSPPYWGLRSYDACGCVAAGKANPDCLRCDGTGKLEEVSANQLGLEATPDLYLTNMVAVFRELRRVLADHGTCWVNLGDSYATNGTEKGSGNLTEAREQGMHGSFKVTPSSLRDRSARLPNQRPPGLKPKDLVGIPWRVAVALQNDGWYLRADIIWAKPNPMPESVTDRPTKAHEYVFLLSKQPRYWYDAEAVRERQSTPATGMENRNPPPNKGELRGMTRAGNRTADGWIPNGYNNPAGRNIRSVWEIATQPYSEAHFATFPEELVRRCLLAGCPEWVCGTCRKPRERIVEYGDKRPVRGNPIDEGGTPISDMKAGSARLVYNGDKQMVRTDEGWSFLKRSILGHHWSDCGHNNYRPGVVLDPFGGSGTTALVARKHGRHAVLIELSEEYCQLAARRLQQLSLLAEAVRCDR